ncbi:UNVERIFIED_CONTAM: hypothetical protein FKN15_067971 [Acipenser sinensis]
MSLMMVICTRVSHQQRESPGADRGGLGGQGGTGETEEVKQGAGGDVKGGKTEETVKAPPELSKRVSTIRSTTTHHPTVSAPSTCTSALNQDW